MFRTRLQMSSKHFGNMLLTSDKQLADVCCKFVDVHHKITGKITNTCQEMSMSKT